MGKGSRVRASRQVDRRGRPEAPAGVAFGIGVGPRVPTGPEAPRARGDGVVGRMRDQDAVWRAAARVTDALVRLEELGAARTEARRAVEARDEEVEVAVAHLRADDAVAPRPR